VGPEKAWAGDNKKTDKERKKSNFKSKESGTSLSTKNRGEQKEGGRGRDINDRILERRKQSRGKGAKSKVQREGT